MDRLPSASGQKYWVPIQELDPGYSQIIQDSVPCFAMTEIFLTSAEIKQSFLYQTNKTQINELLKFESEYGLS